MLDLFSKTNLKKNLLVGIGVILPSILVIWITVWTYQKIDILFSSALDLINNQLPFKVPDIIGNIILLLILVSIVFITGVIVSTSLGKWFHNHFDKLIEKIHPLYKLVRDAVKLFIESLDSDDGLISRMVEVETSFATDGVLPAFLAGDCEDIFNNNEDEDEMLTVFILHGPFGNSGQPARLPKKRIHPMGDVTITEFLSKYNLRFGYGLRAKLSIQKVKATAL